MSRESKQSSFFPGKLNVSRVRPCQYKYNHNDGIKKTCIFTSIDFSRSWDNYCNIFLKGKKAFDDEYISLHGILRVILT